MKKDTPLEVAIREYLSFVGVGEVIGDETFKNTPRRYKEALEELTSGYFIKPEDVLEKTFEADCDEMIVVSGIEYWSLCEHHLLPFFGRATVGYVPDGGKVVGLSKLPRLVHCFSRRLQMQERMTRQIGEAITQGLSPKGVGVVVTGRHLCMEIRGVKTKADTRTTYLGGVLYDDERARSEFLGAVNGGG